MDELKNNLQKLFLDLDQSKIKMDQKDILSIVKQITEVILFINSQKIDYHNIRTENIFVKLLN